MGPGYTLSIPRLEIRAGEKLAITGPSGCGKSTALDLLGMVLTPSHVENFVFVPNEHEGVDVAKCWMRGQRDRLAGLRQRHISYILQTGGLLPFLTVSENMELSARVLAQPDRKGHVKQIARRLGIQELFRCLPQRLSIGERQRVAIGRALACRPAVILADEPTASLDPAHAGTVMELLLEAASDYSATLILVTHSRKIVRDYGLKELPMQIHTRKQGGVTAVLESGQ